MGEIGVKGLNIKIEIPRFISIRETLTIVDIHLFSDASINGICMVGYAVIYQPPNNINLGLITGKSRLVKRNLTISHIELIATEMSAISLKTSKMLSIIKT